MEAINTKEIKIEEELLNLNDKICKSFKSIFVGDDLDKVVTFICPFKNTQNEKSVIYYLHNNQDKTICEKSLKIVKPCCIDSFWFFNPQNLPNRHFNRVLKKLSNKTLDTFSIFVSNAQIKAKYYT